ncbi:hypothetical protein AB0I72_19970 [Nocardiopsis sp. NPDC049922]|uniref:hypothetical protein n=1 Tax=Nocardiopsis sp. NPDC049922 TaxID=3155157 RepID=UPI0033C90F7E
MHRWAATACMAAGVWILAGPGWALLSLGGLVWLLAPAGSGELRADALRQRATGAAAAARAAWGRMRTAPRRFIAVMTMVVGALLLPLGVGVLTGALVGVAAGAGAGAVTAGVAAAGLSLLTGWNA